MVFSANRAERLSGGQIRNARNPGVLPWGGTERNTPNLWTMRSGTAHLSLAIDVDSDPISGSISNGCHVERPFTGWIELAAAIEAVRSARHGSEGSEPEGKAG